MYSSSSPPLYPRLKKQTHLTSPWVQTSPYQSFSSPWFASGPLWVRPPRLRAWGRQLSVGWWGLGLERWKRSLLRQGSFDRELLGYSSFNPLPLTHNTTTTPTPQPWPPISFTPSYQYMNDLVLHLVGLPQPQHPFNSPSLMSFASTYLLITIEKM